MPLKHSDFGALPPSGLKDAELAERDRLAAVTEESRRVLQSLRNAWVASASALGLSATNTYANVMATLTTDRGTANRLVRLLRMERVEASDVSHFPGTRGWVRVAASVRSKSAVPRKTVEKLDRSVRDFAALLRRSGGSKEAALRDMAPRSFNGKADAVTQTHGTGPQTRGTGSEAELYDWFAVHEKLIGYSSEARLDCNILFAREPEAPRLDLAVIQAFKALRGRSDALPFTLGLFAAHPQDADGDVTLAPEVTGVERSAAKRLKVEPPRTFELLKGYTSRPLPRVIKALEAEIETIFIEPQWVNRPDRKDLAVLFNRPQAATHWRENPWVELSASSRHPTRRLIIDRYVPRELAEQATANYGIFRGNLLMQPDGPWYDRLPQNSQLERIGPADLALSTEPIDGYADLMRESFRHLQCDPSGLTLFRVVVENPVPFVKYAIFFSCESQADSTRR